MNAHSNNLARRLVILAGLFVGIAVASARGDGSIEFNGDDSPSSGTSKLVNALADVLDGSNTMTITVWAKATGDGEGDYGVLVQLPLANSPDDFVFSHGDGPNLYHLFVDWGNGQAQWNYGANDLTWNCHQITYDLSSTADPAIYINGTLQNETAGPGVASGTPPTPGVGYSVGNVSAGTNTWQGQIAHVQIHNRILSAFELEACRRVPGSVKNGLRLYLPMTTASDTTDHSGNGFHAFPTALTTAAEGPVVSQLDLPRGITMLRPGKSSTTQYVIPRRYNGTDHPAGQLRGWGPMSVLMGDPNTSNLPPATNAIVITEGYTEDISEWQNGSQDTTFAAVLQPTVANCTIIGYSPDDWVSQGTVGDQPTVNNDEDPDLYDGYIAHGTGGIVDNVCVMGIPGTGMQVWRPNNRRSGFYRPHDRLKWVLTRLSFRRLFRGLFNDAHDSYMSDIEVEAFRDYGVRIGSAMTGAVQFARIHTYGGGIYEGPHYGAGIWIDGANCHGGDIYPENSPLGLYISTNASHCKVNGIYSHTCAVANIQANGSRSEISGMRIDAMEVGIANAGQFNRFSDGNINLAGGSTGIVLGNGTNIVIRGITIDSDAAADGIGLVSNTELNDCWIQIHMYGGAKGFDFDATGGSIGSNNYMWLTTDGTTDPIDLPTVNSTNRIWLNGVQQ